MTQDQKNQKLAEWAGEANKYAVMKGGYYYRPGAHGYTDRIEEAWHLPKAEAEKELVRGEPMQIVKVPPRNYFTSLDAVHELVDELDNAKLMDYVDVLVCIIHEVSPGYFDNIGWQEAADIAKATADECAEALGRTLGLWKEGE